MGCSLCLQPFSGEYCDHKAVGVYTCTCCGSSLFNSSTKFDSGCGYPSFYECIKDSVLQKKARSYDMESTDLRCSKCDSHLGHVFDNGPPPTGLCYCINSVSLKFVPEKEPT